MNDRRLMMLACALAPALALGEEPAGAAQRPEIVEEIEVKGVRHPRVDTLEMREVRETPARDLAEALDQQLGLGKVRRGGIASDLTLRGLKKDDVAVVVDGTRVHGSCPSRMDPPSFHLDYAEVDRVEVRRGPFDVTQPGAVGGVVDVRTRTARSGPGAEANVGYGAFGAMEASAVASRGWERADLLAGGSFKQAHPYASGDGESFTLAVPATLGGQPNGGRYRSAAADRTAYDVRSGWAKVGLRPADGQRVEIAYTRQSAVDVLYPYLLMDGLADDTDRVNVTWRADRAGPLSAALAQAYFSRVVHDMDDRERCSSAAVPGTCSGALPRGYSMRTLARSSVLGGKVQGALAEAELLGEAVAGADFYVRGWDNTTTRVNRTTLAYQDEASIPDVSIVDVGAYAQVKRALGADLRGTAGARLDVARSRAAVDRTTLYETFLPGADLARSRTDLLLSGNVQLDFRAAPRTSVFLGYGHGARVPDPQERYIALSGMMGKPSWVGDPSLRPVRSDELDAGARWADGRTLVKAEVFHAWLGDYVTLAATSVTPEGGMPVAAKTYRNVSARTLGGEASVRTALPLHLFASVAAGYTRGENVTAGTPLAEIPPLRAAVSLRWDAGALFVEAEEQWAARQDRVDPALQERPTDAWFVTNLRLGGEWKGVKVIAGVRNAFDRYYFEHLSYQRDPWASGAKVPEPGRIVYSNVQYRFR